MSISKEFQRFMRFLRRAPFKPIRAYVYRHTGLLPFYHYSADGSPAPAKRDLARLMSADQMPTPNLSGGYGTILKQWWEEHGLGGRCLLISETSGVKRVFADAYPETAFVCTDYFTDLRADNVCDVIWDICAPPPPELGPGTFTSVICNATLEHVVDPAGAMRHFASLLAPAGMAYVGTHTPGFQYHAFPKDYVRFWPDWFTDLSSVVPDLGLLSLLCAEGIAFAMYRKRANL